MHLIFSMHCSIWGQIKQLVCCHYSCIMQEIQIHQQNSKTRSKYLWKKKKRYASCQMKKNKDEHLLVCKFSPTSFNKWRPINIGGENQIWYQANTSKVQILECSWNIQLSSFFQPNFQTVSKPFWESFLEFCITFQNKILYWVFS